MLEAIEGMTTREMLEALAKLPCKTCGGSLHLHADAGLPDQASYLVYDCSSCQVDGQPTGLHYVALALTHRCDNIWCLGSGTEPHPEELDKEQACQTCQGTSRSLRAVHLEDVVVAAADKSAPLGCGDAVIGAVIEAAIDGKTAEEVLYAAVAALYAAMETPHA